jgi:hypothetical protein
MSVWKLGWQWFAYVASMLWLLATRFDAWTWPRMCLLALAFAVGLRAIGRWEFQRFQESERRRAAELSLDFGRRERPGRHSNADDFDA